MAQAKVFIDGQQHEWRVNTPAFLQEVFDNGVDKRMGIFFQPANIFRELLIEVAERASELDDPVMNALMCRLTLYGVADPYDKENYDKELLHKTLNSKEYLQYKANKSK